MHVALKRKITEWLARNQDIIISVKINLFSPWYSWVTLNNNHSTHILLETKLKMCNNETIILKDDLELLVMTNKWKWKWFLFYRTNIIHMTHSVLRRLNLSCINVQDSLQQCCSSICEGWHFTLTWKTHAWLHHFF